MVSDQRPGLDPRRLVGLMNSAIERLGLQLGGYAVLTEAATGAYTVTPVLAALAGARTFALANTTRYASADEIQKATLDLARVAGIRDSIELVHEKDPDLLKRVDIVTNSGQVRPIDKATVSHLKSSSVVPLMYETWEFRTIYPEWPGKLRSKGLAGQAADTASTKTAMRCGPGRDEAR